MNRSLFRVTRRATTAGICLTALFVVSTAPASAATTVVCSGASYSACTAHGHTAHGYASHSHTSYWGAYPGHNCTNYDSYVLAVVNGAKRPKINLGIAYQWAAHAKSAGYKVNHTPALGAVAQWNRNVPGAGNSGHVAMIEHVYKSGSTITAIAVSEDNYSKGPFKWEIIHRSDSHWPSNIIHVKDR